MQTVGTVASLARYPVKSLQGETVETVALREDGVDGDRRFAFRDLETGRIASAKQPRPWRALLDLAARHETDRVLVRTPSGDELPISSDGTAGQPCKKCGIVTTNRVNDPTRTEPAGSSRPTARTHYRLRRTVPEPGTTQAVAARSTDSWMGAQDTLVDPEARGSGTPVLAAKDRPRHSPLQRLPTGQERPVSLPADYTVTVILCATAGDPRRA